tara:strand:+ start:489 stop:926 length:438 start_codon:yes stop_codon:yes gene_type:complete
MWTKILLTFTFLTASPAFAEDPQFTNLDTGDPAPFAGTLFNPAAVSELIVDSQFSMEECDLRVQFEKDRTAADYQLQLDILQASYDSLQERHSLLMDIKQQEIDTYRGMALERPNRNNHWWLAGGVVSGIGLTIGVLWATQEIQQ